MSVYNASKLIKVLNDIDQLASFPVEGTINLLFSNPIDEQNIKQYIFITKEKPTTVPVNIAKSDVHYIGDFGVSNNSIVDYNYTVTSGGSSVNNAPVYNIQPIEPLDVDNNYWIVVSKNTAPLFYGLQKSNSIGPSTASLTISPTADTSTLTATSTFLITVQSNSVLANGGNTITYSLSINGVSSVTGKPLETSSQVIALSNGVTVSFNSKVPILAGETFTATLSPFTRSGTTSVQAITTYIDSTVGPVPDDEASTKLTQDNILKFYEINGYSRRIAEGGNSSVGNVIPSTGQVVADVNTTFIYPGTILIEIGDGRTSYDPATLTPDFFSFDTGPAFDNYLLSNLAGASTTMNEGFYNVTNTPGPPDYSNISQYIIKYKLVPNDYGYNCVVRLIIMEDLTGIVPVGQQLLVQADV